ncbi:MAG: hypothetical protein M5U19_16340 [Microthrixaceae bacterium]|nr:hypothetical protein [Microthrixaceae bacterium]
MLGSQWRGGERERCRDRHPPQQRIHRRLRHSGVCGARYRFGRVLGENDYGQLGNGDTARVDPRKGTATVEGVSNASTVSTAFGYACAALEDGTATCWGLNSTGQLGDGTTTAHETPIAVQALSGVTAVAAGEGTACALIDDGTVSCWGGSR